MHKVRGLAMPDGRLILWSLAGILVMLALLQATCPAPRNLAIHFQPQTQCAKCLEAPSCGSPPQSFFEAGNLCMDQPA